VIARLRPRRTGPQHGITLQIPIVDHG